MASKASSLMVLLSLAAPVWSLTKTTNWLADATCKGDPTSLTFGDVMIMSFPDLPGAHKGVTGSFGSDDRKLSLNIATTTNTTFVPDGDAVCNPDAKDSRQCFFWRGGSFYPEKSATWKIDDGTKAYNGSASNEGFDWVNRDAYAGKKDPLSSFPRGWDSVTFGSSQSNLHFDQFPMTLVNDVNFPFSSGMLGLASNSRFLDEAVAAGLAPSHSWGLDYGAADKAGEFVVGGYNAARVDTKTWKEWPINADPAIPCPLQIKIKSMSFQGLQLNSDSFNACLEPAMWTMILPVEVQENFNETIIQTSGADWVETTWEYFYYKTRTPEEPLFDSDMEVELEDGMKVTIPASELFTKRRNLVPTGGWNETNNQYQVLMGTAAFKDGREPIVQLGAPFLSQLYLAVDYEYNRLNIGPIVRGGDSADLKALGCSEGTADGDDSDSVDALGSDADKDKTEKKVNAGVIAGSVIGGLGALALVVGAVFFLRRRRGKLPTYEESGHPMATNDMYKSQYDGPGSLPNQSAGHNTGVYETEGTQINSITPLRAELQ